MPAAALCTVCLAGWLQLPVARPPLTGGAVCLRLWPTTDRARGLSALEVALHTLKRAAVLAGMAEPQAIYLYGTLLLYGHWTPDYSQRYVQRSSHLRFEVERVPYNS